VLTKDANKVYLYFSVMQTGGVEVTVAQGLIVSDNVPTERERERERERGSETISRDQLRQ